uniref:CCHC-type domain-containing protein n=1 Tax=Tanacetum cinerariifolium TaxID=118510 RepID=A0A6L2MXK7_TANCI|nr:hypothetical protein [Tanacetum cinerariifolium]
MLSPSRPASRWYKYLLHALKRVLVVHTNLSMATLADKAILSGADNRPPMLEKEMYDSWKRKIELYMLNKQHGRMILESVENGPLVWPLIKENGVTRPKKYSELSPTKAIQADCDINATNIILQGLPPEVYAFVSNHKVAKELWERIQLLTRGTSLTKQERECKLYDEFDKFTYKKGEHYYGSPYQSQQYSDNQSSPPLSITYPSNNYQSSIHHNIYSPSSSIPQLGYDPSVNQQLKFSQPDSVLIVLVFQKGDDPIDLRNSSNPRQQATINNERVTLQPIQGRQTSLAAGTSRTYTPGASGNNSKKQRTVICYNCKWEGHMSKQCAKPKRKRDDSWFKDKVLLVQAQANGQILHEEELAFFADPRIVEAQATQTVITYNAAYQANDFDAYDSDYNEINTAKVALKANLFHYGSDDFVEKAQQLEPKLYDGNVIEKTNATVICDSKETLMLAEESRSKMLLKQKDLKMSEKKVNTTPVDYAVLNQLSQDFETRFVPQTELSAEQAFWS